MAISLLSVEGKEDVGEGKREIGEGRRLSLTHDEPPMRIFSVWKGKREGGTLLTCRHKEEPFSICGKRHPAVLFGGVSGSFTRLQGFRAPAIHSIHTP